MKSVILLMLLEEKDKNIKIRRVSLINKLAFTKKD